MKENNPPKILSVSRIEKSPIDTCKLTLLVEDTSKKKRLKAQHGLSFHVRASSQETILNLVFDTGPSPNILSHNLKALNLKLDDLDVIAVSHGHHDHTNGLPEILRRIRSCIPVLYHPELFAAKFAYKPILTYIGPNFKPPSITDRGVPVTNIEPLSITRGIMISGEIPLKTDFEKPQGFWRMNDEGFVEDLMIDEQALIIDINTKGICVITGCAHRGIINTVRHAKRISGREKVYAIVGGFHLSKASDQLIHATMTELNKINPRFIYPCHCTGKKSIEMLSEYFGHRCRSIETGDVITL